MKALQLILLGGFAMTAQIVAGKASSVASSASAQGDWGGDRLRLSIDASGGHIQSDCASGAITGPIVLGKNGKFTARGTFDIDQPGPQSADEGSASARARFSGQIVNDRMRLSITQTSSPTPQVYNLRKGVRPKMIRCL